MRPLQIVGIDIGAYSGMTFFESSPPVPVRAKVNSVE